MSLNEDDYYGRLIAKHTMRALLPLALRLSQLLATLESRRDSAQVTFPRLLGTLCARMVAVERVAAWN